MNYSDYRFTLDIQIHQAQVSVPVTLNDTARKLYIGLTDGRKPYTIADGCRAVFAAKKPDGTTILNDCIIEKNTTIVYEFSQNTTSCEGIVNCEVRLYDTEGKELTSPQFLIVVDGKVVRDEEIVISESEQTALNNILVSEQGRVAAEEERVTAEVGRTQKFNSFYNKAVAIGGFVPVDAPRWTGGANLNKTTATVTDIVENPDGSHKVIFNRKEEYFTDGGFEQSTANESLVHLNSVEKNDNGWTGLYFGEAGRYATIRPAYNGESLNGSSYIEVQGAWSSLCKSVKLEPHTYYTFSFWQKGTKGKFISNISVMAKANDGNVKYVRSPEGAYWRDTEGYEDLFNVGEDNLAGSADINAVIKEDNKWQKVEIKFKTRECEYVDIFLYFGYYSQAVFCFDDFSLTKTLNEEFTAIYDVGNDVPPEVTVGSVFYFERAVASGQKFTRFEWASSYAIKELYKYMEQLNETAFEDLTKEIGDISSALDNIIAIQNSLIGGGSV